MLRMFWVCAVGFYINVLHFPPRFVLQKQSQVVPRLMWTVQAVFITVYIDN